MVTCSHLLSVLVYLWLHSADNALSKEFKKKSSIFLMPGTVWCGPGNDAENYNDIGINRQTDLCCRDHDTCPMKIDSFTYKYNYFNFSPFTLLHCDCDYQFGHCLAKEKNSISKLVGKIYFRTTKTYCFRVEETTEKFCHLEIFGKCAWEGEEETVRKAKLYKLPAWAIFSNSKKVLQG